MKQGAIKVKYCKDKRACDDTRSYLLFLCVTLITAQRKVAEQRRIILKKCHSLSLVPQNWN